MRLSESSCQTFQSCSPRKFGNGEYHVTRTFHSSVLILMRAGVLRFTEDGQDVTLRENEYYIQRQGLYQQGRKPSDCPEYFYIHFNGVYTDGEDGLPLRGVYSPTTVMPYLHLLEQTYLLPEKRAFALNGLFYTVLDCLNQPPRDRENEAALAETLSYIRENYAERGFSTESVTERFSYNKDYFIRLFRQSYAITPYRYITKLRIESAKQLLLSSRKKLSEIAGLCGYNDYSVFYKSFQKETGMSPEQWLRQSVTGE